MTDINDLFARDPLSLTRTDLTSIVEKFRASRGQFNLGNKMAGKTKPPTAKEEKTATLIKGLGSDFTLEL